MVVCSRIYFKPNLSKCFNHTNDKHAKILIVCSSMSSLREGFKKKTRQIIHILWISVFSDPWKRGVKIQFKKIWKLFSVFIYIRHIKHLGIKSIPNIEKNWRISPPPNMTNNSWHIIHVAQLWINIYKNCNIFVYIPC